jgi:hypothetical protein
VSFLSWWRLRLRKQMKSMMLWSVVLPPGALCFAPSPNGPVASQGLSSSHDEKAFSQFSKCCSHSIDGFSLKHLLFVCHNTVCQRLACGRSRLPSQSSSTRKSTLYYWLWQEDIESGYCLVYTKQYICFKSEIWKTRARLTFTFQRGYLGR